MQDYPVVGYDGVDRPYYAVPTQVELKHMSIRKRGEYLVPCSVCGHKLEATHKYVTEEITSEGVSDRVVSHLNCPPQIKT